MNVSGIQGGDFGPISWTESSAVRVRGVRGVCGVGDKLLASRELVESQADVKE